MKQPVSYDNVGPSAGYQLGQKRKERSDCVEPVQNTNRALPTRYRTHDLISPPYDTPARPPAAVKRDAPPAHGTPRAAADMAALERDGGAGPRKRMRVRFAPAVHIAVYRAEAEFAADAALCVSPIQTGFSAALQHEDGKSDAEKGERFVKARRRLRALATLAPAGEPPPPPPPGEGAGSRRQFAQRVIGQVAAVFAQVRRRRRAARRAARPAARPPPAGGRGCCACADCRRRGGLRWCVWARGPGMRG